MMMLQKIPFLSRLSTIALVGLLLLSCVLMVPRAARGDETNVLDRREILESHDWWDNRDFDWYVEHIPFLETPDAELDKTWYYRWDMITKHLVYGSPEHGYAATEFIDRPPWSGRYGTISCPLGFQLYDMRWLRDPRYVRDFTAYWLNVPGAQPRKYSTWLADSSEAVQHVWPDDQFTGSLLEGLVSNYEAWEKRHWVPERKMFWQTGMADGMETNIASRQTKNWFAGARGFRPTLNSYLYADALAIASIAERKGNEELAAEYRAKAADLKTQVEKNLWDSKREFFFQMYRDTETHNGHTLEAGSLTHQTGQFAGSPHGRELIGFVPWQFNLPGPGYEAAWKYLMDPDYFHAEFGPTVTERNDPMFRISPNCCVWSGNSWPFATGQTLKAMANALRNYENLPITANHYYKLLSIYSNTHRKGGRPYIAEACHPDTGSWDGHDRFNHSEHYFHSTFADLIVTGLIGLEPGPGSEVKLRPLAPSEWDYFCLDGVMCKGHDLAILWDRDGSRYGRGAGLMVLSGGNKIAERPDLGELKFLLNPDLKRTRRQQPELYNVAVNNTGKAWPRAIASSFDHLYPPHKLLDGQAWYMESPPNRWQPHHDDESPWVGVDFGTERTVSELRVFPLDSINDIIPDSAGSRNSDRRIQVPSAMTVEVWQDNKWESAEVTAKPSIPRGRQANRHKFGSPIRTRKVRVLMTPQNDSGVAMSEIEAWGAASLPLTEPPPPSDNLAASATVTTSSENRPDPGTKAIDGIVNYDLNGGPNRWATKRRPKETPTDQLGSDWLELDFGDRKSFNEVRLHFCRSRYGMGAPARYELKVKDGDRWTPIPSQDKSPSQPISETINVIKFPVIARRYLRLEVSHGDRKPVCALSEIEIFSRAAKKPQQFRSGD